MTMDCLSTISWDDPLVFGPIAAAIIVGIFQIIVVRMKRRGRLDGTAAPDKPTTTTEITNAPKIEIENKPTNTLTQITKHGLDEEGVGKSVSKAVDPVAQSVDSLHEKMAALEGQLAKAQLAPKQPVPDSGDRLKVKAVEFFNAGVDAANQGEIGQARGHWLDALKLEPDNANAHNNLGVALKAKGDLDGAIQHYNEALRIDPDDTDAHNNLGNALTAKGDLDGAIEHYNEALRIDPDNAAAHNSLGLALRANGDLAGAFEHYNEALRIDPDNANAHNSFGLALQVKGDLAGAIEHYNEALRIDPDNANAHIGIGLALVAKGDLDGAIEHCNQALRIDPDHANAHDNLGCAFALRKDAAGAVAALAKAIELDERYRAWARTDPDYDAIRDDPAFRKLVYGE